MMIKFYLLFFAAFAVTSAPYLLQAQEKNTKEKFNQSTEKAEASSKTLSEVNVSARKPTVVRTMEKTIVNVASSARFIGTTVMDVLEKSPGIRVDKDDQIYMNGKSGVVIMIDSKQTYMSGTDLSSLLKSMQSSEVETIELISSPSAKYDAAGTAGMINIRTKKNKQFGANGNVTLGTGYGLTSKYNGSTNLNFRKDKFNVFGNYNYGDFGTKGRLDMIRIFNNQGTTTTYQMQSDFNDRKTNNAYKAGLDYNLNTHHTLGFLVNGYYNSSTTPDNPSFTTVNAILPDHSTAAGYTQVHDQNNQRYKNTGYNLNYLGKLDTLGREISIDLDYSNYNGAARDYRSIDTVFMQNAGTYYVKNNTLSTIKIKTLKLDYTTPINKIIKIEAGIKSGWITTNNDLEYLKSLADDQHFEVYPEYTNQFIYKENINAGYLNLFSECRHLLQAK